MFSDRLIEVTARRLGVDPAEAVESMRERFACDLADGRFEPSDNQESALLTGITSTWVLRRDTAEIVASWPTHPDGSEPLPAQPSADA